MVSYNREVNMKTRMLKKLSLSRETLLSLQSIRDYGKPDRTEVTCSDCKTACVRCK
jgi:hypothetical protein